MGLIEGCLKVLNQSRNGADAKCSSTIWWRIPLLFLQFISSTNCGGEQNTGWWGETSTLLQLNGSAQQHGKPLHKRVSSILTWSLTLGLLIYTQGNFKCPLNHSQLLEWTPCCSGWGSYKRHVKEGRIKQHGEKKPDTDCVANILATHSDSFDPWKQQGGL